MTEVNVIPCRFTAKQVKECNDSGFLTYPEFLDNLYTRNGRSELYIFVKDLQEHNGKVKYAVCPDNMPFLARGFAQQFPRIKWIYPLHKMEEIEELEVVDDPIFTYDSIFSFIGFPHRKKFRNYTLNYFLKIVPYEKRWYLGFWNQKHPEILNEFYGMDTTIPETVAGKFGQIWVDWNQTFTPRMKSKNNIMLIKNIYNLAKALTKLKDISKQKVLLND